MSARSKASICTARFIPALLFLLVAFVSWVFVGRLSIDYLLNPPRENIPQRVTLGIALPIVYFVLLLPVAACWMRLLLVVLRDPGYLPQGSGSGNSDQHSSRPGMEEFWMKDVFVCDPNGYPIWCYSCNSWKRDRAHHSQDAGRCTRKMDHFCPWVGGVVGERSMKFFIQFLFYSMLATGYATIVLAYYVAQYKGDIQWYVALGISAFFLLFTLGMVANSLNLVFKNTTTIENASRRIHLAVLLPPELQLDHLSPPPPAKFTTSSDDDSERPLTSELDDPAHASYFSGQTRLVKSSTTPLSQAPPKSKLWKNTITYPLQLLVDRPPIPAPIPRKFAVLRCPPNVNPWNLGTSYRNFKAVFGARLHDWLLPIKHSPCTDHSSMVSEFPLGPEFQLLLEDAGLFQAEEHVIRDNQPNAQRSRTRKRRLDAGWRNGERPDGWISEQEARRIRNEWRRRNDQSKAQDAEIS